MNVIVQNFLEKNNQLEKDLKIQILQNELIEDKFTELRQVSVLLQDRMKQMVEEPKDDDVQQIQSICITPSQKMEEQFDTIEAKIEQRQTAPKTNLEQSN